MVLALQDHEAAPPYLPCERVGSRTMKQFQDDQRGLQVARLSLISFGEKFRDDRLDKNNMKSKLAEAMLRKAVRDATQAEPEMARLLYEGTERINRLQDSNAPLFDVLGAYGQMAAESFSCIMDLTGPTRELLQAISEWVFFVDMICDYDEDYRDGVYNGLKVEGCETFRAYFDCHYPQFLSLAGRATDRLVNALMSVRDDSRLWNTLFKIINHAVDTVIPDCIEGKDIKFHYFRNLAEQFGKRQKQNREIKRLGLKK